MRIVEKQRRNPRINLPINVKTHVKPGGVNTRRSPPVCFSGLSASVIPVSGLCAGIMLGREESTLRNIENKVRNPDQGPWMRHN